MKRFITLPKFLLNLKYNNTFNKATDDVALIYVGTNC